MKLSIIVPVYNIGGFIEHCVRSVQSLKTEFELILVDDGSTDGSGALCDALARKDGRLRVIHQENGGLSAARNTGIKNSRGDYLMFLDGDDMLDAPAADRLLSALDFAPDVIVGLYKNYYTDRQSACPEDDGGISAREGLVGAGEFLKLLPKDGRSFYMIACRFVVRREFIKRHALLFLPGIYHEDEEWTARLMCAAESVYISREYFYYYRQNRAGAITAAVKPKHIRDCFTILERDGALLDRLKNDSARREYLMDRMGQLWLNIVLNFHVLPHEEREEALRRLKAHLKTGRLKLHGTVGRISAASVRLLGVKATAELLGTVKACKEKLKQAK